MKQTTCLASYICALSLGMVMTAQTAVSQVGRTIEGNTPRFINSAKNVGGANATDTIEVAVWLKPHNREQMDKLAADLYNPNSAHYRDWLKPSEIARRFAPTAEEAHQVGEFLSSHNVPVVEVGPFNLFVRGRGTVANIEKAFRVKINNFQLKSEIYRANTSDPYIEGAAAELVASITGLDNLQYKHPARTASASHGQRPSTGFESASPASDSTFFTANCFTGTKTDSFSGYTIYGAPVSATYKGNTYNGAQNPSGCGYTPQEIWKAYNLTGLYKEGFDGAGQTIAIIDWCGSPTIEADANAFSAEFGLPPLTSANFKIYYSSTTPTCGGVDPEINIDVEWAHAIAPGAKIALVVPPSASFTDVNEAQLYALSRGLGNVISGSYGAEERFISAPVLYEEDLINEMSTIAGVSANFSSGDYGDYLFDLPSSNPVGNVSAPASTTYATAVGGVSLALKSDDTIAWQTGWGTNFNILDDFDSVSDPPIYGYFEFGSGGGTSGFFAKPDFQSSLKGAGRLLPDISWLADPYTGGVIAITEPGIYPITFQVYGGTSLACPMFSALWAIANQEAGIPLGQAAQYLYSMPHGAITDVLPKGSSTNVTGTIKDPDATVYDAAQLAGPLDGTVTYYSALWDAPLESGTTYLLTFGTDSGLRTGPGWDNVTGLGTPNGKAFADYFNPNYIP